MPDPIVGCYGRYISFVASKLVLLRPPTAKMNPFLGTASVIQGSDTGGGNTPFGAMYSSNITPDRDTGA